MPTSDTGGPRPSGTSAEAGSGASPAQAMTTGTASLDVLLAEIDLESEGASGQVIGLIDRHGTLALLHPVLVEGLAGMIADDQGRGEAVAEDIRAHCRRRKIGISGFRQRLQAAVAQARAANREAQAAAEGAGSELHPAYRFEEGRVLKRHIDRSSGAGSWVPFIFSRFKVVALSTGSDEGEGIVVSLQDSDGKEHELAIPRAKLAGDGSEVISALLARGLKLDAGRQPREWLLGLLLTASPPERRVAISRAGWHEREGARVYARPDRIIGSKDGFVLDVASSFHAKGFGVSGDLEGWQLAVPAALRGNSVAILAVGLSLAAPLLRLLDEPGGGFHLAGPSKIGKTLHAALAESVWGRPGRDGFGRTWRSTANGLEMVALSRNDCLLSLDELSELHPKDASLAAYMLANGSPKQRATKKFSISGHRRAGAS